MKSTQTKKLLGFVGLLILISFGFGIYRYLVPAGPDLGPVPNPLIDMATSSNAKERIELPKNEFRDVFFGDLHIHTSFSFDAFIGGNNASPSMAYEFAKGKEIEVYGKKLKIQRPLDFAAVTDHSEFLGELYTVQTQGASGHNTLMARYFRSIGLDTVKMRNLFNQIASVADRPQRERTHLDFFKGYETTQSAWNIALAAAETHYEPGKFTTFAAYEWTLGALGAHYHRNIFFRDMKVPSYPISAFEARTREELWAHLEELSQQGATLMAIPHNSNLSAGGAFPETNSEGSPIDLAYVQLSQKYEPLVEIHQAKGNSEVHPSLWTNDEFANFEAYTHEPLSENSYVRYALKKGLEYEAKLGTNPYKYGIIGSTDTHNATPGNTEEDGEYIGNHALVDLDPEGRKMRRWVLDPTLKPYEAVNPGGLVAVWAKANTRGEIFDAMKRKETYATSGGRIQLRFFAGYGFKQPDGSYENFLKEGYGKGVPMGSDLSKGGTMPEFLIWAVKDPEGANLDRVQIIKGWYKEGELFEKIYTVALSDGRKTHPDGTVPDNGATVDMTTGEWAKDKGAVELYTHWKDPNFDPDAKAFYYLRVLELPTASWRLWDKIRYGIKYKETDALVIRERAWSSPIWYSP